MRSSSTRTAASATIPSPRSPAAPFMVASVPMLSMTSVIIRRAAITRPRSFARELEDLAEVAAVGEVVGLELGGLHQGVERAHEVAQAEREEDAEPVVALG